VLGKIWFLESRDHSSGGLAAMEGWNEHLRGLYGSETLSDAIVLLATPEQAVAARAAMAAAAGAGPSSSAASSAPAKAKGKKGRGAAAHAPAAPPSAPVADPMLAHGKPIPAHSLVLCMSPVWMAKLLTGVGQVDTTASGKKVCRQHKLARMRRKPPWPFFPRATRPCCLH
jgi:hypothetical protein